MSAFYFQPFEVDSNQIMLNLRYKYTLCRELYYFEIKTFCDFLSKCICLAFIHFENSDPNKFKSTISWVLHFVFISEVSNTVTINHLQLFFSVSYLLTKIYIWWRKLCTVSSEYLCFINKLLLIIVNLNISIESFFQIRTFCIDSLFSGSRSNV